MRRTEAALKLVGSERFQTLAFALGKVLAKEKYVGASQIRRVLEAADPERETHSVETHSVETIPKGPWFRVTSEGGRMLYHGSSEADANAI